MMSLERHLYWNFTHHEYYMILPALGISIIISLGAYILVRGYTLLAQLGRNSVS